MDIYNEALAKTEFLEDFEKLFNNNIYNTEALNELPTAYDYIRLGHPLSCVLEWGIAKINHLKTENVISFQSKTVPILAVLRKNLLENKKTQIAFSNELQESFDAEIIKKVYGYNFELNKITSPNEISKFNGSTVFISNQEDFKPINFNPNIDFYISNYAHLGSILLVNGLENENYISEIQHIRRRETVAMTPSNCLEALNILVENSSFKANVKTADENKKSVLNSIKQITDTNSKPLVASSGLSIQYAIMMGLIHDALENHKGKAIKFIVPPNCYGGTNY